MHHRIPVLSAVAFLVAGSSYAQEIPAAGRFDRASMALRSQLEESMAELERLREQLAAEQIPLNKELGTLESELSQVRRELQDKTRALDSRALDVNNLQVEVKRLQDEKTFLSSLLGEYVQKFESRLHIAELQRYRETIQAAQLAAANTGLSEEEVFRAQTALVAKSLERLEDGLGGTTFAGTATDSAGLVRKGTFALVGPAALFRSDDGREVGTAEQLQSLEPAVLSFEDPESSAAAAQLVESGAGALPFDPTLGNAHKIESTHETLLEHIRKGGPVMIPIFVMAAAGLLIALYKWLTLAWVRRPSSKQLAMLYDAVGRDDRETAARHANAIRGPIGRMLAAGVEHLGESRELIEEVMFETMLKTRLRLQGFLPFVSICAASAPLLGLLGTVTGIINTFKQITIFGAGDVKSLSGGISEALITTEFGLIVAIPALLLHAFLSRKAQGLVGQMEEAGIALVNHAVPATDAAPAAIEIPREVAGARTADPELVRAQIKEVLGDLLGPLVDGDRELAAGRK